MKEDDSALKITEDDLVRVLKGTSLTAHFQPILNLKNRTVIGYKALIRGIRKEDGNPIQPIPLFESAKIGNRTIELDRYCKDEILNLFAKIPQPENNYLLFINFESSLLDTIEPHNDNFINQMVQRKINPFQVVIEIIESQETDLKNLIRFVEFYRYHGFFIALDSGGMGYSNYNRIPAIKPDIIKIDRSIVKNMEKDYHKREIFRLLGNLAKKTGALVLAEGIETEEEALCAIELDADLAQGYYFARPQPFQKGINEIPQQMASRAQDRYRRHKVKEIKSLRSRYQLYDKISRNLLERIKDKEPDDFDSVLEEMIDSYHYLEALYVLDDRGIQLTKTVLNKNIKVRQNSLFRCAQKGEDLSLKKYFYLLVDIELEKFVTENYISLATGNLCRTISILFKTENNNTYVLCMDISDSHGEFIYLKGE